MSLKINLLNRLLKYKWKRIDMPKWIKLKRYSCDGGDCKIYIKGKNFIYKIVVSNWKGANQTEKVWRKLRRK